MSETKEAKLKEIEIWCYENADELMRMGLGVLSHDLTKIGDSINGILYFKRTSK